MLHKINLPAEAQYLRWIVDLQRALLAALCDPAVAPADVTVDWVVAKLPHLDVSWVQSLCGRRDAVAKQNKPLIEHMRVLAGLSSGTKQTLLSEFEADIGFEDAFRADATRPLILHGLGCIKDAASCGAVRAFFEFFYQPAFYRDFGYKIPLPDGTVVCFHKETYLSAFKEANSVEVCPMCDGYLNTPEVDHFYPKHAQPFLDCHPLNLTPICHECNSTSRKGARMPLTTGAVNPADGWFHPHLRSLTDWNAGLPHPDHFTISFRRNSDSLYPVLCSNDLITQTRLDNMRQLLKLDERWRLRLQQRVQATRKRIEVWQRLEGKLKTNQDLLIKLSEWAIDAQSDIGNIPAIVESYYFKEAARNTPDLFDELWIAATGADSITS
jgi:hypothetical protein